MGRGTAEPARRLGGGAEGSASLRCACACLLSELLYGRCEGSACVIVKVHVQERLHQCAGVVVPPLPVLCAHARPGRGHRSTLSILARQLRVKEEDVSHGNAEAHGDRDAHAGPLREGRPSKGHGRPQRTPRIHASTAPAAGGATGQAGRRRRKTHKDSTAQSPCVCD
jgi:hypothetical protein